MVEQAAAAFSTLAAAGLTPEGGSLNKLTKMAIKPTIESLPDKVLLHIFSYLSHKEICNYALVSKEIIEVIK